MPGANQWAGIATGLANLATDYSQRDQRAAQAAEAKARQQKAQLELQDFQQAMPARQRGRDLELQQLEAQTRAVNQQSMKSITIDSLERFNADGDVRHLNRWLADSKKNPVGASMYGEVARYDRLNKSEDNDKMLRQMGYKPEDIYGDPDLQDELIVVTHTDGNQLLLPKESMYAATGFTEYMNDKQMKNMEQKARISQLLRSGQTKSKVTMQERVVADLMRTGQAGSVAEAYGMLKQMDKSNSGRGVTGTSEERAVQQLMESENIGYVEALDLYHTTRRQGAGETNESRFVGEYMQNNEGATYEEAVGEYKNLNKTSTQKQIGDATEIRKNLDNMDWLNLDVGSLTPVDRARVYRDSIGPLEQLTGFNLGNEEKRVIRDLRNLTELGGTAGTELKPDEVGLIDSTLGGLKSYIIDDVGAKKGTAAYETFRNVFRNSLYGASLTNSEIKAFNKAAGTLGQQYQPIMSQLKTQMGTVKNNLESIRDTNDPDIAHYYLGKPIEDIDRSIEAIENVMNDPRLRMTKAEQRGSVKVERVDSSNAKPVAPDVGGNTSDAFDFDAAMKEAGL